MKTLFFLFCCFFSFSLAAQDSITVNIMMPKDADKYGEVITEYIDGARSTCPQKWKFVPRSVRISQNDDKLKAIVYAAASQFCAFEEGTAVHYLQVEGDTAYVLLGMNVDGWAGVSHSIALVTPVVEATLKAQPNIKKVVWGEK